MRAMAGISSLPHFPSEGESGVLVKVMADAVTSRPWLSAASLNRSSFFSDGPGKGG
jgi:hypothetical protein